MAEPITTTRGMALQNLAKQLPVANSRIANGQKAAQDMQLQQAVKAAPPQANVQPAAAQTGAAVAQNAGAQMIQNAQQGVQAQGQVAQVAQQEQARAGTERITGLAQGQKGQEMDNVSRLSSISEQAKQELYDKQIQFQKDEQGRTLFNTTQLLDYAKIKAQSDEEAQNYAQTAQQAGQRKLEMLKTAYSKISEDLEQKWRLAEQKKDQKALQEIADMKRAMAEKMRKAENEMANYGAIGGAVGSVGGAIIGAVVTKSPAGAAAGATAGGAVGSAAGKNISTR